MLVRALAIGAIAGGVLRVVDSFTTQSFSPDVLALIYFITDVFLLLGIAGIYWSQRATVGTTGTIGTIIFAFGIVVIRISAFASSGTDGYQLGAAIALIGLGVLSGAVLLRRDYADAASILWLAALLFAVAGALGVMTAPMTVVAGVMFGAGFVIAGRRVLQSA